MPVVTAGITEGQQRFLEAVLSEREIPANVRDRIGENLSWRSFSSTIAYLKTFPRVVENAPAPMGPVEPSRNLPNGFYSVDDGLGSYVTFRVTTKKFSDGTPHRVIGYLNRTDEKWAYVNFGFIGSRGLQTWRSREVPNRVIGAAQVLLEGNADEYHDYFINNAEAFALATGHCSACGKFIRVPKSILRGFGPDCAKRLGLR